MTVISVDLSNRPYDIHVRAGLLADVGAVLTPYARNGRILVVTDENVAQAVLPKFEATLRDAGIACATFTLPAGEAGKSWTQLERLTDWLLEQHVERSDHIIALGGGVVGDITGFAAHIIKRGCAFVQIPTTLLAQVDSSVGGKTAINSAAGKNLVGAFHQPALVLIDPELLSTLPTRQLAAGFAEVVKYGLIDDKAFFEFCADNLDSFFGGDPDIRAQAIIRSVQSKARIVAADETERTGTRALLNLGHTFGHALEADTGFPTGYFMARQSPLAWRWRFDTRCGLAFAPHKMRKM
jgi:3-dehydroquinate synthase